MEILTILFITLLFLVVVIKVDFIRLLYFLWKFKSFKKNSKKFERKLDKARSKILVLGDSTAFGFGIRDRNNSVAGRLARKFKQSSVENLGVVGLTTSGLVDVVKKINGKYDLIVLQIIGNDIVKLKKIKEARKNMEIILTKVKKLGKKVVLLPPGNMGLAPVWPFLLSRFFTRRTRKFRDMLMKLAEKHKVLYTDLFKERREDVSHKEPLKYYAADYFHPSDDAYGIWFETLMGVLNKEKIKFAI